MPSNSAGVNNPAYRHGHTEGGFFSPTYQSWACMVQRGTNTKLAAAGHYALRGINVCAAWLSFDSFLADMGERPLGHTLDRVNSNGNYEPSNCRWATAAQQANNKRSSRRVTIGEDTKTVTEWCRTLGISHHTVWARINQYGFTAYDALTRPKQDRSAAAKKMTVGRVANFNGKD